MAFKALDMCRAYRQRFWEAKPLPPTAVLSGLYSSLGLVSWRRIYQWITSPVTPPEGTAGVGTANYVFTENQEQTDELSWICHPERQDKSRVSSG